MKAKITTDAVYNLTGIELLAYAEFLNGDVLTTSNVSSIALSVIDRGNSDTVDVDGAALTVADVIHALRTDDRWTKGGDGYCLSYTLPDTYRPLGGTDQAPRVYRVEMLITPVSGKPIALVWDIPTVALLGFTAE